MSKLSRGKKGEASVAKALEAIPAEHVLLNDKTFLDDKNQMTHQVDHIYIHPHGVFVLETKNYFGHIEVDEDGAWRKVSRGQSERLRNPLHQNKGHAKILRKILGEEYEVVPVVVFAKNNAPYVPDDNVIDLKDLALFIDSYPYRSLLSTKQMQRANALLEQASVRVSAKEHVENISYLKQYRKEVEAEIAFALEKGICPRCGKPMLRKEYRFRCSSCDFKFSL